MNGVLSYNLFNVLIEDEETDNEIIDEYPSEHRDHVYGEKGFISIKDRENTKKSTKHSRIKHLHKSSKKVPKMPLKKQNETEVKKQIDLKRCHGCNKDHMPLPKFCRWWEERRMERKVPVNNIEQLSNEKKKILL